MSVTKCGKLEFSWGLYLDFMNASLSLFLSQVLYSKPFIIFKTFIIIIRNLYIRSSVGFNKNFFLCNCINHNNLHQF